MKAVFDSSMSSEVSDTQTPNKGLSRNPFRVGKKKESFGDALLSLDSVKLPTKKKDVTAHREKSEDKDIFDYDSDSDDVFTREQKDEKENGKGCAGEKLAVKKESTSGNARKKPLKSADNKGTFMEKWVTKGDKKRSNNNDYGSGKAHSKTERQSDVEYTKQDIEDILNEDTFGYSS